MEADDYASSSGELDMRAVQGMGTNMMQRLVLYIMINEFGFGRMNEGARFVPESEGNVWFWI